MSRSRWGALLVVVALGVGTSWAYEWQQVRIQWWAGSGPNSVLCVVDFWPYNQDQDSVAFGYHFSGPQITGLDLLNGLQAVGRGFTFAQSGGFVTDIWYDRDELHYHAGYDWPQSYVSYWVSTDFGETWDYAPAGAGQRILLPNDTDGWLGQPGDDYDSEPVAPIGVPVLRCDLNCDGYVNFDDINPFVMVLSNPAHYAEMYPNCPLANGDINQDGSVDFGDINPFVDVCMFVDP